jgi:hypothetical protein
VPAGGKEETQERVALSAGLLLPSVSIVRLFWVTFVKWNIVAAAQHAGFKAAKRGVSFSTFYFGRHFSS